jgi:hypothetical protein
VAFWRKSHVSETYCHIKYPEEELDLGGLASPAASANPTKYKGKLTNLARAQQKRKRATCSVGTTGRTLQNKRTLYNRTMYIYKYIELYIYIYIYIYIHIHIQTDIYIYIYICIYIHAHVYTCKCVHIYIYIYTSIHLYIYLYKYICVCM